MITAKFFTETECGNWKPVEFKFNKEQIDNGQSPLSFNGVHIFSLMFEDGTIYDCSKRKFRSESAFPPSEYREYMKNILTN